MSDFTYWDERFYEDGQIISPDEPMMRCNECGSKYSRDYECEGCGNISDEAGAKCRWCKCTCEEEE